MTGARLILNENDLFGLPDPLRGLVRFACTRMTRSYKPVTLALMMGLADDKGRVALEALAYQFYGFYLNRELLGLPVERRPFALDPPVEHGTSDARGLLVRYPLERFRRAGHVEYAERDIVRLTPDGLAGALSPDMRHLVGLCCGESIGRYYDLLLTA